MKILLFIGVLWVTKASGDAPHHSYGPPPSKAPSSSYGAPQPEAPLVVYGEPAKAPSQSYGQPPSKAPLKSYVSSSHKYPVVLDLAKKNKVIHVKGLKGYPKEAIPAYIVPIPYHSKHYKQKHYEPYHPHDDGHYHHVPYDHGHYDHGPYDHGHYDHGHYDHGHYGPIFTKHGGKTYFKDSIRDKFSHLKYAKDYLKHGFKSLKNKLLEWKGRMLRAKGHYYIEKGEDMLKKAKAKGHYHDKDHYHHDDKGHYDHHHDKGHYDHHHDKGHYDHHDTKSYDTYKAPPSAYAAIPVQHDAYPAKEVEEIDHVYEFGKKYKGYYDTAYKRPKGKFFKKGKGAYYLMPHKKGVKGAYYLMPYSPEPKQITKGKGYSPPNEAPPSKAYGAPPVPSKDYGAPPPPSKAYGTPTVHKDSPESYGEVVDSQYGPPKVTDIVISEEKPLVYGEPHDTGTTSFQVTVESQNSETFIEPRGRQKPGKFLGTIEPGESVSFEDLSDIQGDIVLHVIDDSRFGKQLDIEEIAEILRNNDKNVNSGSRDRRKSQKSLQDLIKEAQNYEAEKVKRKATYLKFYSSPPTRYGENAARTDILQTDLKTDRDAKST